MEKNKNQKLGINELPIIYGYVCKYYDENGNEVTPSGEPIMKSDKSLLFYNAIDTIGFSSNEVVKTTIFSCVGIPDQGRYTIKTIVNSPRESYTGKVDEDVISHEVVTYFTETGERPHVPCTNVNLFEEIYPEELIAQYGILSNENIRKLLSYYKFTQEEAMRFATFILYNDKIKNKEEILKVISEKYPKYSCVSDLVTGTSKKMVR